jgi:hypothetical protein
MPKAGSTLQYNLCKELLGDSIVKDYGWMTGAQLTRGFTPERGTPATHAILKSHMVPRRLAETHDRTELRIISSHRDLRDVAASDREFTDGKTFDEILVTLDFHVTELERISTYETSLIQRYETMIEDLPAIVRQLAEHLGCSPAESEVVEVVSRWQVDAVEERIGTGGPAETPRDRPRLLERLTRRVAGRSKPTTNGPKWDADTLLHPTHISQAKGRHGRYQGVLTADEIALIEDRYGDWLREHGYL